MNDRLFRGCGTALPTPFLDGAVDYPALEAMIRRQLEAGVDALVLCGTTAEPASLTGEERRRILELGVSLASGRAQVIAGAGTNDTRETARRVREAANLGVDGLLLVTPYYNKTTQAGLAEHFARAAEAAEGLPVILYNVPARTGLNMTPETAARLCELPNVLGIKEARGDIAQAARLISFCPDAAVYCGCDGQALPMMALGAQGVISVVSNVAPRQMTALAHAMLEGNLGMARRLHETLLPLMEALFASVSPIPLKAALSALGLCENELRLPLVPMTDPAPLISCLVRLGL